MAAPGKIISASGVEADATAVSADNLSSQIAGMSKHQLYQIVSQMKDLIQQNQQQARQILIANPQLTKTLFQAQIMLGMVRAPDSIPPVALTPPVQPSAAAATSQTPQQPPLQSSALQVAPTPPPQSVGMFQPQSSPQPASQQPLPQVSSSNLQQSQTNLSMQANQPSLPFQQPVQTPSHLLPAGPVQQSLQQASSQPPLPSHPPPLPQQPRPLAPLSQVQQQNTQAMGFVSSAVPQSYHSQPSYMQQGGPTAQSNVNPAFQPMHAPPLPSQLPPQHLFQVPREMGANVSASGGMLQVGGGILESGRVLNTGVTTGPPPSMTWNQGLPLTGPTGMLQGTPSTHMLPGQSFVGVGVGVPSTMVPGPSTNLSQSFNQALPQSQLPQQPQHQSQMPIELEQQKALIQQVMNLTPEQINSLPPEQRHQVLQLQQAFRSQTG